MSAVTFHANPMSSKPQDTADGPRKRRKRAPAAGAAADCFTCSNRGVKCDRKRPYCTSCLEAGQDCAGYKTQLTWGVGVASRGKLRGLSLPVAGTKKVAEPSSPPRKKRPSIAQSDVSLTSPRAPSRVSGQPGPSNGSNQAQQHMRHYKNGSMSEMPPVSHGMATSPISVGWSNTFSNTMYDNPPQISPISYSAPAQGGQYFENVRQPVYQGNSNSYPMSSNLTNLINPAFHMPESYPAHTEAYDTGGYLTPIILSESMPTPILEEDIEEIPRDDFAISDTLSISSAPMMFDMSLSLSPFSSIGSVGKTPRMQYLIQYYAEVIAPVIVAFDRPSNPFRDQILTLAAKSESLQHALSALAASNLRQRRESGALSTGKTLPARRSSQAHLSLTSDALFETSLPPREQKREEVYHKYHAVQSLNQALANHSLRKDDSVLATLLILCLFHICDSGVARFQTQFAGVKKLLTMRRNELGASDSSTRWMTRLFTWFDAMAATTNEREGQFDNHHLDQSAHSDSEWSYETLAGLDGKLFKTLSKLGRLNILSQGKPVEQSATLVSRPPPFATDFSRFDGNGWMRAVDDENFFTSKTSNPTLQEQFWREWREVRQALQVWNMDNYPYESAGPVLTDEQRLDVEHISNAFRYSALLYTERLGNPNLPSSDEKIQYWVRCALHHIQLVRSDVYLLWALFITGSECVREEERNIIRERCLDIQKDSGFVNNASSLGLLEKVWAAMPAVGVDSNGFSHVHYQNPNHGIGNGPQAENGLRFRNFMLTDGAEGEWIVV